MEAWRAEKRVEPTRQVEEKYGLILRDPRTLDERAVYSLMVSHQNLLSSLKEVVKILQDVMESRLSFRAVTMPGAKEAIAVAEQLEALNESPFYQQGDMLGRRSGKLEAS